MVKTNNEGRLWTFGDFIAACYSIWGYRRAKGFVRLAVNAHLVFFHGRERFVITETQHEDSLFKSNSRPSRLGRAPIPSTFSGEDE